MNQDNNINNYFPYLPISNLFIENYMTTANPTFVIIYIYLLKMFMNREEIYLEKVSENLNILQTDIINSLDYWKSLRLINYQRLEDNRLEVKFLDIKSCSANAISTKLEIENFKEDEVTIYSQKDEIQKLFRIAENKLAKTLSYQDRKILISLHEAYGMSIEILAILFTYCMENGKSNFNYIEKVAIDWCENSIDTVEKVEEYLKLFNSEYKKIMLAFGIRNREPIKEETDIMKVWLVDYKMPIDIVEEACTRTIKNAGKPSFKYANSIIKNWKKQNVKSLEDIQRIEREFEINKNSENEKTRKIIEENKRRVNYNNKFINYKQTAPDYELLRKIEIMDLKGGIEN